MKKFVLVILPALIWATLPGCGSAQDADQPAVGSISVNPKPDSDEGLKVGKPATTPAK
jgi:hypothetical protein